MRTETLVLDIKPNGDSRCLHSDLIPLQTLGRVSVRRASQVEFNELWQEWVVIKPNGNMMDPLFTSPSRKCCLDFERDNWGALL